MDEQFYEYDGRVIVATSYGSFVQLAFADEDEQMPEQLDGAFESFDEANRALDDYFNNTSTYLAFS